MRNSRFLEEVTLSAWPALQTVFVDGWVVRFSNGFGRRANSVNPLFHSVRSFEENLAECEALEAFRLRSDNLYERVRALFFLYAIHRFHLPARPELNPGGRIPFAGYEQFQRSNTLAPEPPDISDSCTLKLVVCSGSSLSGSFRSLRINLPLPP